MGSDPKYELILPQRPRLPVARPAAGADLFDPEAERLLADPYRRRAARQLVERVYLDEFDGHTLRTNVTLRQQQTAFVGTVRLALLRQTDHETCTVFAALMRYAEYAGVGAQPTNGYGAVNLLRLVPAPSATGTAHH